MPQQRTSAVARRLGLAIAVGGLIAAVPVQVSASEPGSTDVDPAAQELVDRYAPIFMLKEQGGPCDTQGEPFDPMTVEAILDNPQIALRQVGNGDPTAMRAPGASDLFELGEGFYLDFPGDSLNPECIYEKDYDRYAAKYPSTIYAHIVQQPDRPDLLAVQYWTYWYYNDWNNKHESDWEFVQVLLPASSIDEALTVEPVAVGYAQHTGGEKADWDDDKLERDGTHPLVYSSARSHASYFGAALYMGRSGSEGFGCDNTDGPSRRVEPEVVLLPETVTSADDPFAWMAYEGRWGERHGGANNGPTGPVGKPRWTAPVDWHEDLRDSSFIVPAGDSTAAELVDAFCSVVGWGSVKFIEYVSSPIRLVVMLATLVGLTLFMIRRTMWNKVPLTPLRRRRRAGQIFRAACTLYRRHPGTFLAIGLLIVPIGVAASFLSSIIERIPFFGSLFVISDTEGTGGRLVAATIIGGVTNAISLVLVSAAIAWVLGSAEGVRPSARGSFDAVAGRARQLSVTFALAAVAVVLLDVSVVGLPIGIWLTVRWQFLSQVTMLDGLDGRAALRRSGNLVSGRWFHTALVAIVATGVINGLGVVVGLLMLVLFTGLPLWVLSVVVTVCQVIVTPLGALALTLLYGDAVAEQGERDDPDPEEDDEDEELIVAI